MRTTVFIYALLDAAGRFDYVGESLDPVRRFKEHKAAGIVLAEVPWADRRAQERAFIKVFREQGCPLRNKNLGGGGPVEHSPAARAKISAWNKGKMPWNKGKAAWNKGKTMSAEERAKSSAGHMGQVAWNKGKTMSEEARANNSAGHMGQVPWNKGKKGQVPWNKGKKCPNISAAKTGKKYPKLSAALKGKKRGPTAAAE